MKAKKSSGPDWRKVLESIIMMPESAARTVFPETSLIPPNAKALARYLSGDETPLDGGDIRAMQNLILEAIAQAESEGRDYVKYEDYGKGAKNKTDAISEMGVLEGSGIPATTLGRFNFSKNEDGTYEIRDTYDFNNKEQSKSKLERELGIAPESSPYEAFMASQEGKGLNVSDLYKSVRNAVSYFNPNEEPKEQSFTIAPEYGMKKTIQKKPSYFKGGMIAKKK